MADVALGEVQAEGSEGRERLLAVDGWGGS